MYIINGYQATISGMAVTFDTPVVKWEVLRDALCQAAGIKEARWSFYLPVESQPGAQLGDQVGRYDLSTGPKDFYLILYPNLSPEAYREFLAA